MTASPPDLVVFAAASDLYLELDRFTLTFGDREGVDAYGGSLEGLVSRLVEGGSEVLILHPIPKLRLEAGGRSGPAECGFGPLMLAAELCEPTHSRVAAEDRRGVSQRVETRVAQATGASTWDPFSFFCGEASCDVRRDGDWVYRDPRHLSVAGAEMLVPELLEVVSDVLDGERRDD